MPKFITIGYGDEDGYARSDKEARNAAHDHDAERAKQGDIMGIAGKPVQVRNANDIKTEVTAGAFLSSKLPVAGFAVVEAENLRAAIEIAAKSPCAVNFGVVEVWPLEEAPSGR